MNVLTASLGVWNPWQQGRKCDGHKENGYQKREHSPQKNVRISGSPLEGVCTETDCRDCCDQKQWLALQHPLSRLRIVTTV